MGSTHSSEHYREASGIRRFTQHGTAIRRSSAGPGNEQTLGSITCRTLNKLYGRRLNGRAVTPTGWRRSRLYA